MYVNKNPILELLPDGKKMVLVEDITICGHKVPSGFQTDLASVPRPLWWLFPRWGKHSRAAILHDYLYTAQPVTKTEADKMFREKMGDDGVGAVSRWMMWMAVAWFGGGAWERKSAFGLNKF